MNITVAKELYKTAQNTLNEKNQKEYESIIEKIVVAIAMNRSEVTVWGDDKINDSVIKKLESDGYTVEVFHGSYGSQGEVDYSVSGWTAD